VVDALNLNMEHKSRNYESPSLAALFLFNNYQFILKSFTRLVREGGSYCSKLGG